MRLPSRRARLRLVALVAAVLVAPLALGDEGPAAEARPASRTKQFVLSPEGNHLWAYDADTGESQLLIRGRNAGDPGVPEPGTEDDRRDINGQICVSPDGRHFVAGEDTVVSSTTGGDGGSSHDAEIAGWGLFRIGGAAIGALSAEQVGKLAPESGPVPPGQDAGYTGDPDNYGCGFLDRERLFTTAIGNTLPGEPANGQLFLWFAPFDAGFGIVPPGDQPGYYAGEVAHCQIDDTLATAGGIAIDDNGDVYVATNRPDDLGNPGGVWRYRGAWPRSLEQCTPEYLAENIVKEQVIPAAAGPLPDPRSPTPSAVVLSPQDTLYVSSVFSGTVSEYTKAGAWVRDVYPLSPVAPRTGPTGDTPFGLAVTADGSLWIADLGIVVGAPAPGLGSVVRVHPSGPADLPRPADTVADGLTFPDGLGVYTVTAVPNATSEWPCGSWGMYGRTLAREFSTECPTPIDPTTVPLLRPAWVFRPPMRTDAEGNLDQTTFTATPAVVDGVVYVGGWDGHMYALDARTGALRWETPVEPAPGATFGPIVSSAAVADVRRSGSTVRLVIFGAGPRVYALDADTGREVWVRYVGNLPDQDDPAEVESSPVVWQDTVYVGMDVHNEPGELTGGARGGLLALDAATGKIRWRYEPEAAAGQPPSGCGGVWGSPVIDPETGRLYFGTANCPAVSGNPALPMEEITALDAKRGTHLWTFRPHQPGGQDSYEDLDEDFGATPNLFRDADGRKVLGAGSKDGGYYALDPATGEVLWYTNVVQPAPGVGGFIGSPAVWRGRVFGGTAIGTPPYYHALDGRDGSVAWQGLSGPSYGASAVANGVVFAPALDSTLKAFDAATGRLLWTGLLAGPGSSGPVVVGDTVFVGAGTSTSDLCAKDRPGSELCFLAFDTALGQQGGVHAFRLSPPHP